MNTGVVQRFFPAGDAYKAGGLFEGAGAEALDVAQGAPARETASAFTMFDDARSKLRADAGNVGKQGGARGIQSTPTLLTQLSTTRILRLLRRKGVIEDDAVNADETLAETEPALAELAVASSLGRIPAGPALRQKNPIRLRPGRDLEYPKGLCAAAHSFSLHAATTAEADDPVGREALCKYILRPPIAQENIRLSSDDLVRVQLKRPFSGGTFALDLDPLSL